MLVVGLLRLIFNLLRNCLFKFSVVWVVWVVVCNDVLVIVSGFLGVFVLINVGSVGFYCLGLVLVGVVILIIRLVIIVVI